jgi:hypothetical protein
MIGIRSRVAKKFDEEFASPPERADATIPGPMRYAADAECIASRITDAANTRWRREMPAISSGLRSWHDTRATLNERKYAH